MPEVRIIQAFIVGPTGVGKTDVAMILARRLGSEILSVDSRQIYRRLEIGTAKPTLEQRALVLHHLIDLLEPLDACSAGKFARLFRQTCDELRRRSTSGIAVGGAGLYVDACLGRLHPLPAADRAVRARLEEVVRRGGYRALHRLLESVDPDSAERIAPRDIQRITRALEIRELTGERMSDILREAIDTPVPPLEAPVFHLTRTRVDLYARIEARCRSMVDAGLPHEVHALLDAGVPRDAPGLRTVGYAEWVKWACGDLDHDEACLHFIRNSRRYAKRQETWFRNRHPDRIVISIAAEEPPEATAERIARLI